MIVRGLSFVVLVDSVLVDGVLVDEYEGEFVISSSDAMHQLPACSPLLSTQVDLFPFSLEKVTSPI